MNQKILFLSTFLFALFFASCTRKVATPSISIIGKTTQGLIDIQADGVGATLPKRELSAQRFILNEVIFNGIPSANVKDVRLPLIDRNITLSSKQKKKVNELLKSDDLGKFFSSFTRYSDTRAFNANNERVERFSGQLRLDVLRADLENKGVIRKFGL